MVGMAIFVLGKPTRGKTTCGSGRLAGGGVGRWKQRSDLKQQGRIYKRKFMFLFQDNL